MHAPHDTENLSQAAWTTRELATDPHARADKADRVQRMFGAIAGSYDLNNRLHSFGLDQRRRRSLVRRCDVRPTDDVLDVACGTGDLTEAFAAAGARSVTGVDFTPRMLEIARRKSSSRRRAAGVPTPDYEQGDAMSLRFEDASFDVVSIAFGIRNVSEPIVALREFRRVLRPGGRLAILEFDRPPNALVAALNRLYSERIMPLTATLLARDRSGAYRYLPKSVATFHGAESLAQLALSAGFALVRAFPMTFGVVVASLACVDA